MLHKNWIYAGVAALVLVLAGVWAFAPSPVEVELAPVTQGRFETSIDEDGKTRLNERYVVAAPLAGNLSRISLREGDVVAADSPVATLTPLLPALLDERTRQELQARVEGAQAGIQRGQARVARARVGYEQAAHDALRNQELAQQGFIASARLDNDRLATLAAQREVEAATADSHVAAHDLEQAQAALAAVRQPATASAGRSFVLHAPVAGRVLRVLQSSAASVALGTPLLEIGDTQHLEVVADLLTADALAVSPGARVLIERWGGPQPLQGRVLRVEPAAFTKVSALGVEEQRVRVLVEITSAFEAWQALGDAYRVSLRIITLSQEQALQVPTSAVFPLPATSGKTADKPANGGSVPSQRYAVFVMDGGHARLTPVSLSARNGSMAWIGGLPGAPAPSLKPGTPVIVYPPTAVHDGARVKARKV